jgi:DNA polymerase (family X)
MTAAGEDLAELPGIGKDLAAKMETLATTGHVAVLEEIERRTPAGLLAVLDIQGLGPKRARLLNEQLDIRSLGELAAAAKAGKTRELPGFGAKSEKHVLQEAEKRAAAAAPRQARRGYRRTAVEPSSRGAASDRPPSPAAIAAARKPSAISTSSSRAREVPK